MSVSTLSIIQAQRSTILRTQEQLRDASTEVSTGHYADVSATLGYRTGQTVSFRLQQTSIDAQQTSNVMIGQRLDSTQTILGSLATTAQDFLKALIGAQQDPNSIGALVTQAKAGFEQLTATLNTSNDGQYLFGGSNTGTKPVAFDQYEGSAAEQATNDSLDQFLDDHGATSVADLSADDLSSYVDDAFSKLFNADPVTGTDAWKGTWSNANDAAVSNKITSSESIDVSVSANSQAFRDLAAAFSMMANLGVSDMNQSARQALIGKTIDKLNGGIAGVTGIQTDVGLRQQRLDSANDRLGSQQAVLKASISNLEDVDPYEASTRVSMLTTQLQTAYALTSKIQDLSLLNYL